MDSTPCDLGRGMFVCKADLIAVCGQPIEHHHPNTRGMQGSMQMPCKWLQAAVTVKKQDSISVDERKMSQRMQKHQCVTDTTPGSPRVNETFNGCSTSRPSAEIVNEADGVLLQLNGGSTRSHTYDFPPVIPGNKICYKLLILFQVDGCRLVPEKILSRRARVVGVRRHCCSKNDILDLKKLVGNKQGKGCNV